MLFFINIINIIFIFEINFYDDIEFKFIFTFIILYRFIIDKNLRFFYLII